MGARGRPCRVCAGDVMLLEQINSMLKSGSGSTALAKLFPTYSKDQIARHKKHTSLPTAPTVSGDELAESNERLAELANELRLQYAAACSAGDSKLALDCSKALSRVEVERHKRIVKKVEDDAQGGDKLDLNTPEAIDRLLSEYRERKDQRQQREAELRARGYLNCPMCNSDKNLIHPSGIAQLWRPIKKIYDDYCDQKQAEAGAKEQDNADTNVVTV